MAQSPDYTGDSANHPPVSEIMDEWARTGRPAMGSRPIAPNQGQKIDRGMDQSDDPQPAQAAHETVNALREDPGQFQIAGLKADPIEVAYRWADGQSQCANCNYYSADERSCSKVEGQIEPAAICDLWEAVPSFCGDEKPNYSAYEINMAGAIFGQNFDAGCGIGAGGFQPGNTCAKGDGGGGEEESGGGGDPTPSQPSQPSEPKAGQEAVPISDWEKEWGPMESPEDLPAPPAEQEGVPISSLEEEWGPMESPEDLPPINVDPQTGKMTPPAEQETVPISSLEKEWGPMEGPDLEQNPTTGQWEEPPPGGFPPVGATGRERGSVPGEPDYWDQQHLDDPIESEEILPDSAPWVKNPETGNWEQPDKMTPPNLQGMSQEQLLVEQQKELEQSMKGGPVPEYWQDEKDMAGPNEDLPSIHVDPATGKMAKPLRTAQEVGLERAAQSRPEPPEPPAPAPEAAPEPQRPSKWERFKEGAKATGQAVGGALTSIGKNLPPSRGMMLRGFSAGDHRMASEMFGESFAAERAPVGGVDVQGTFYPGGQFIPGEVMAQATEEEKDAVENGGANPPPAPVGATGRERGSVPGEPDYWDQQHLDDPIESEEILPDSAPWVKNPETGNWEQPDKMTPPEEISGPEAGERMQRLSADIWDFGDPPAGPTPGVDPPRDAGDWERFMDDLNATPDVQELNARFDDGWDMMVNNPKPNPFEPGKIMGDSSRAEPTYYSMWAHTDDQGNFSPERTALHDAIAGSMLNPNAVAPEGQKPKLFILAGPPGAGKTTAGLKFAEQAGIQLPHGDDMGNATVINSDAVKEMLPEYEGWNAGLLHEESGEIAENRIRSEAIAQNHNIVLDFTANNDKKVKEQAEKFAAAGYEIHMASVTVPAELSGYRAYKRFDDNAFARDPSREGGRYVPPGYAYGVAAGGGPDRSYDALKQMEAVKSWVKVDNDVPFGTPPVMLDQGQRTSTADPDQLQKDFDRATGDDDDPYVDPYADRLNPWPMPDSEE